ncbi:MAG: hypothetical protein NTZ72_10075 [Afipia sp.]|jgi:hypothetical protein|nr:hypothetical protein [Afipia sp.]
MPWHNLALELAGLIGAVVAIAHGMILQRLIIKPFSDVAVADGRFSVTARKLLPPLLQFSTLVWFAGGIALATAPWLDAQARLSISVMVGATYLFGAVGNFWATRGRSPGWMLMALALGLIAFGAVTPPSQV